LVSREWFPALTRENVRLVTSPIVEITEQGLRTGDGEEHCVDTIIYGTGFKANEYLGSVTIRGRDGRTLREDWRDGAEAYLGITVPGYPNLFLLYGPNTNGVNSIIFMHEAQANYIMGALRALRRRGGGALEVRARVTRRYNQRVQAAMVGTVWTAGCDNYFRTANGKVVTQLPYSGGRYWLRTRLFDRWRYRGSKGEKDRRVASPS
jgi:cation diffusion facilitator CzcD-associated flavoprotein CzcO